MVDFATDRGGFISSLEGVSVGDSFMIWEGRRDSRLVKVDCTRVTAKQCVIGGYKYRIEDAWGLGGDTWNPTPRLLPLDEEALKADQEKHEVNDMRCKLGNVNWKNIADGPVRAIYSILTTGNDGSSSKESAA